MIIPTRGRSDMIRKLLNSINRTAKDFFSFELVFVYDDDDKKTGDALKAYQYEYTAIDIRIFHRKRNDNISDKYYNWLLKSGNLIGDYYWVLGDDIMMITEGWDILIIKAIENFLFDKPDRICCAYPMDTSQNKPVIREAQGKQWGWFPIITREAAEAVGYILPPQYPTHGADIYLAKIYNAIYRYCPIYNVSIHTISHRTEGIPNDKTAKDVGRIAEKNSKYALENFDKFFKKDNTLLRTKIHERVGSQK